MIECPACRAENPPGARFCNGCGARLGEPVAAATERKVITALFCDLVGSTAAAEGADPEDVDRILTRYAAMVRTLIESHGGVVEKFIGDAVVGVFGVPVAHEDDPERAVRAGLRVIDDASRLPGLGSGTLRLRIGINTGETLVRMAVDPGDGERFLAGDAVNTAARIQAVAPEMGVAVGLATYEATRTSFEYAALPPATLKGKAERVAVYQAIEPSSRLGTDVVRRDLGRLVGRQAQISRLTQAFDAAIATTSLRSIAIVGEPGMGKSRLVSELLNEVDARPVLVTWRQGRCLPYGTGISFWAIGEIVKAHAGILDSDPAPIAEAKLDQVLATSDERAWLREQLMPLLGIESATRSTREEQFEAWRRFLVLLAEQRPTVLVFEDLHWADDAMLMFFEGLVAHDVDAPLLVVGTMRPDVLDRRPESIAGADVIRLVSLTGEETHDLLDGLVAPDRLAPDVADPILERSAGNPLFAESSVRLLQDRDLLVADDGVLSLRPDAVLPVPDSINALLAARLDALPSAWKSMLADASVIGKVYWAGAVEAMGERAHDDVEAAMAGLARRGLIMAAPGSSMAGEQEYSFGHALARDVAYAALPRADRVSRHVAAARWIETKATERLDDVAAVLAYHYAAALELARAIGDSDLTPGLEASAFRFTSLAGERALGLDVATGVQLLGQALELAPPGHPERAAALDRYGTALFHQGRYPEAAGALEEAVSVFGDAGDTAGTARALARLHSTYRALGDPRYEEVLRKAVVLLEPLGPSPELADALARRASALAVQGRADASIGGLRRALAVAEAAAFPRATDAAGFRGGVLGFMGFARTTTGDAGGLDDMRQAIDLSAQAGFGLRAAVLYNNLAFQLGSFRGPDAAVDVVDEGIGFTTGRGLRGEASSLAALRLHLQFDLGEHQAVLETALPIEAQLEDHGDLTSLLEVRATVVRIATLRGRRASAERLTWLERSARDSGDPELLVVGLGVVSAALAAIEPDRARAVIAEVAVENGDGAPTWYPRLAPMLVRAALLVEDVALAASIAEGFEPHNPYGEHARVAATAAVLEAQGDTEGAASAYAEAADRWRMGVVPERAHALLGQARTLAALDCHEAADAARVEAQQLLEAMGAASPVDPAADR